MTAKKTSYEKKKTKKVRKSREINSPMEKLVKSSLKAILFSALAAFLFILLGTFVLFKTQDPAAGALPVALLALYLSAIMCGFLCSKFNPGAPLWCGAASAFVFSVLLLLISLPIPAAAKFGAGKKTLLFLGVIAAIFVGAFIGNIKIVKKHRTHRRHR